MLNEQIDYVLVGRPVTHRVEADVAKTLSSVQSKVVELWQRFGPEARIMVTVSAHLPAKHLLGNGSNETSR
jgi:hypothetical protein